MILAYLANTLRIFVCFHSDKNIQAVMLSSALKLSSPPLLQKTSRLAAHRTNHLLRGCAGGLPSTAVTTVIDGATQFPSYKRASCRGTWENEVPLPVTWQKPLTHLFLCSVLSYILFALFLYLEVFYCIHCYVIPQRKSEHLAVIPGVEALEYKSRVKPAVGTNWYISIDFFGSMPLLWFSSGYLAGKSSDGLFF